MSSAKGWSSAPAVAFAASRSGAAADLPLVFADYGMPAAPGTTHLCGGNLFGEPTSAGRQEIVWDALASSSSPEALMRFYRARLGERGLIRTRIGGAWQLPSRDAHPRAMLEIAAPDAWGPFNDCDPPPAGTQAIVVLSMLIGINRSDDKD
jgi:hypothetical protein